MYQHAYFKQPINIFPLNLELQFQRINLRGIYIIIIFG